MIPFSYGNSKLRHPDVGTWHQTPAHLIHDDGILDIVAAVGHDRDCGVLTGTQLVVADELDGLGGEQGSLRVHKQVQEGVQPAQLVVCDVAHRLLAHSTLQPGDEVGQAFSKPARSRVLCK